MVTGRVIKNYNGFYYVDTGNQTLMECRRRGKLKNKILVGDELQITDLGSGKGIIESVFTRSNALRRPAIANIDQMFIVMAAQSPDPNQFLIDKMLMTCEYSGIHPKLCFNKCDLNHAIAERYRDFYQQCDYEVYLVSAKTGEGISELRNLLPGTMTAFGGPSGVGKSSLLSCILGRELSVGQISSKIKRGRHTTRHSEIMQIDEHTYVADTPGFSSLDFEHLDSRELIQLFPDMIDFTANCKFSSCLHKSEPGCSVKEAVKAGKIKKERYKTYCKILDSILERKRHAW